MEAKTTTFDPLQDSQIGTDLSNNPSNQEDDSTLAMTSDLTTGGFDWNKPLELHDDCKMEVDGGTLIGGEMFCSDGVLDWEKKPARVSMVEEDEESLFDSMVCDSDGVLDWEKKLARVSMVEQDEESLFDSMVCDSGARLIPKGFVKLNYKQIVALILRFDRSISDCIF